MSAAVSRPLDPALSLIVEGLRAAGAPPPFWGTPAEARERMARAILAARARHALPVVGAVEDGIAAHDGLHVPVRIYRPPIEAGSLPTVVFFHGGGFVLGSVALMDDIARKLCRDVGAVIVSVDYRLAPEHPFPAAHDDALAAARWAIRNVAALGGDAARVAVAGESAGANLAASTVMTLRDAGRARERVAAQLLIVPGVDMARDTWALEASGRDFPMLTPADLRDIARLAMGDKGALATAVPPSPLRARRFADLPPAIIAVAGHDPLYGEGRAYAACLREAGVEVDLYCFEDMFHPFFGFFEASASARRANDTLCQAFAALLRRPSAEGSTAP